MKKFNLNEFGFGKREKLLDYKIYEFNFDEMIEGFDIVQRAMSAPLLELDSIPLYNLVIPLEQRAFDSLSLLLNCYSGGHSLTDLKETYPTILSYWAAYVDKWIEYQKSDQCSNNSVAAIPLLETDFAYANQLISFGILLGWGNELHRVAAIIDFNNPRRDGMLERLLAPYVPSRGEPPDECTRHLPYFKTLKIFSATGELRPELMKEYLQDWYQASRREPYYNSHKKGTSFKGYWAWEAAVITYLLDIDDSSYRDAKFYPADLVAFARGIDAPRYAHPALRPPELRAETGQVCPKTGTWQTLDIPLQQRKFAAGEIMQAPSAAYGITVWRYIDE
jgi:hypothetical protein